MLEVEKEIKIVFSLVLVLVQYGGFIGRYTLHHIIVNI